MRGKYFFCVPSMVNYGCPPVLSILVAGMLDFLPANRPDYEEISDILGTIIRECQMCRDDKLPEQQ